MGCNPKFYKTQNTRRRAAVVRSNICPGIRYCGMVPNWNIQEIGFGSKVLVVSCECLGSCGLTKHIVSLWEVIKRCPHGNTLSPSLLERQKGNHRVSSVSLLQVWNDLFSSSTDLHCVLEVVCSWLPQERNFEGDLGLHFYMYNIWWQLPETAKVCLFCFSISLTKHKY